MHVWNPKLGFVSVVHHSICNALPSTPVLGGTRVNARRGEARDPVEIEFNVRLRRDIPPHFAFPPQLLSPRSYSIIPIANVSSSSHIPALPDLGTTHPPCAFLSVENRSTRPIFGALPGSHFQASMASPSAVGDVGDTGVALGLFPRQRRYPPPTASAALPDQERNAIFFHQSGPRHS